jgi:hypothetical protein
MSCEEKGLQCIHSGLATLPLSHAEKMDLVDEEDDRGSGLLTALDVLWITKMRMNEIE